MSARTETVLSPLLSDKSADPKPRPRPVSKDYADSEAAGYIESVEDFGIRISLRQAAVLNALAGLLFTAIALAGHRYLRGNRV